MPDENDDLFGEDGDEAVDDFNRLTDLLFQRVSEFADEEDVAAYAVSVAKPSGGGLKLDLDRFRRDADELIREMKKDADRFIAQVRESMAADELGEDES
jgi:hypothetical protein